VEPKSRRMVQSCRLIRIRIVPELAGAFEPNHHQEAFMDFGLFYYCQGRGVPHDQAYHEMLDEIVLAETLGFGECWFAEHHFTDYSLLPSPNLLIASAVQRTSHMRFGNYVNAMSFHHPLRLAAEAAMLDNLARGRFDFGVGKGVRQGEFAKLGLNFDDGVAMTEEAVEIVLKVWTQETCSHTGRFWSFPDCWCAASVVYPTTRCAAHWSSLPRLRFTLGNQW
jgi:alkanesulfonate monooxygenase SsuD/methylene tetrahydromethanopterin reductase-like flavin-dependent oxidoreductase (luciferase family)